MTSLELLGTNSLKIHLRVGDQLGLAIVRGEYPPGSILPPEMKLCEMLGVSRTAMREAIRGLIAKGLIESRPEARDPGARPGVLEPPRSGRPALAARGDRHRVLPRARCSSSATRPSRRLRQLRRKTPMITTARGWKRRFRRWSTPAATTSSGSRRILLSTSRSTSPPTTSSSGRSASFSASR